MQTQDIKSCEPSWEATQEFSQHADEWYVTAAPVDLKISNASTRHVGSVWNENCQSWYKRNGPDSKPYLWCGTVSLDCHIISQRSHNVLDSFLHENAIHHSIRGL